MDILLTGASGFVGRHLVTALAMEHQVIVLNRQSTGATDEIVHDLAQPLPYDRLPRQIDAIIHSAGLVGQYTNSSPLFQRVNVDATKELAEYATRAGAKRFIFFSTGGVYGPSGLKLTEQSATGPLDNYTRSKLAAEIAAQSCEGDLAVQVLRIFFPYGPTQRGRLIPNLIEHILQDKPITLMSTDGWPLVTPIYIYDLIEYVRRVLLVPYSFLANVAGDETVSIRGLADMIGKVCNRTVLYSIEKRTGVLNWSSENAFISRLTNYSPRVPLMSGLERTVASWNLPQVSRVAFTSGRHSVI